MIDMAYVGAIKRSDMAENCCNRYSRTKRAVIEGYFPFSCFQSKRFLTVRYRSYFIGKKSVTVDYYTIDNLSNGVPFRVSCSIENSLTSTK